MVRIAKDLLWERLHVSLASIATPQIFDFLVNFSIQLTQLFLIEHSLVAGIAYHKYSG